MHESGPLLTVISQSYIKDWLKGQRQPRRMRKLLQCTFEVSRGIQMAECQSYIK